ncbi:MAG: hypothetical protein A2002_11625 [Pseudomonadales bacterium GWC1_66_9]|nr:MAG: hypothetical protein A2002_11625 [Pseudomonadales bacterium GWC1_66_9]
MLAQAVGTLAERFRLAGEVQAARASRLDLNRRDLKAVRIAADMATAIAEALSQVRILPGLVLFRGERRSLLGIQYFLSFLKGVFYLVEIFGSTKAGLQHGAKLDHQRVPGGLGFDDILAGEGFLQTGDDLGRSRSIIVSGSLHEFDFQLFRKAKIEVRVCVAHA